jgi:hypothetical protein
MQVRVIFLTQGRRNLYGCIATAIATMSEALVGNGGARP